MTAATIGHASKPKSKRASSLWAENLSSFWFLLPIIIIFFILTVVPLPDVYLEVQHPCWSCNSNSSSANASAGVR